MTDSTRKSAYIPMMTSTDRKEKNTDFRKGGSRSLEPMLYMVWNIHLNSIFKAYAHWRTPSDYFI